MRFKIEDYTTEVILVDYDIFCKTGERIETPASSYTEDELYEKGIGMYDRAQRARGYFPIEKVAE